MELLNENPCVQSLFKEQLSIETVFKKNKENFIVCTVRIIIFATDVEELIYRFHFCTPRAPFPSSLVREIIIHPCPAVDVGTYYQIKF